jgi:hypothetical protein
VRECILDERDSGDIRNTVSGSPHTVVQAGSIHGDVNYYGPGQISSTAIRVIGKAREIDPFELHVHHAAWVGKFAGQVPVLTPYLERDHDRALRAAIRQTADHGPSVFAFLEGDSTVGKTRALFEAIRMITPDWPVVWPVDAEELVRWLDAGKIVSGTVLWLNESQTYLDAEIGAKAAARLDALLRSVPGIVGVGTLWREPYLEKYLKQGEQPDIYAPVRHMLTSPRTVHIVVPDHLTLLEQRAWEELAGHEAGRPDQRVAAALDAADEDGKVIQHLTGGPELLRCYRSGTGFTPVERALITAVLDARRLGHTAPVPRVVLEEACDGYLTPRQRPGGPDWAVTALTALTTGKRADGGSTGIGRMLTALTPDRTASGQEPGYLPDDYLDQNTRDELAEELAPIQLWDALAKHTASAEELGRLGSSAAEQGFYRHAGLFWVRAIVAGSTHYADSLIRLISRTSPGDVDEVTRWIMRHHILRDPGDTADLLEALHEIAADTALSYMLDQRPAQHVDLKDVSDVARLMLTFRRFGMESEARELAVRAASASSISDPYDLMKLIDVLRLIGVRDAMDELLKRAPEEQVELDDEYWLGPLLESLINAGAKSAATSLALRITTHNPGGPSEDLVGLATGIVVLCGREVGEEFLRRMARQLQITDASTAAALIEALQKLGMGADISGLLERNSVDRVRLEGIPSVTRLLRVLREAGAGAAAASLAARAAAQTPLEDLKAIDELTEEIYLLCGPPTARELAARAVEHAEFEDIDSITAVVKALHAAGAEALIADLLERNSADQIQLDDMRAVNQLLEELRRSRAYAAAAGLAARAAMQVSIDDLMYLSDLTESIFMLCGAPTTLTLAARVIEQGHLKESSTIVSVVNMLYLLDAKELIAKLVEMCPIDQVVLQDMNSASRLLKALRRSGEYAAAASLAARAAEEVPLGEWHSLDEFAAEIYIDCGLSVVKRLAARIVEIINVEDTSSAADWIKRLHDLNADEAVSRLLLLNPIERIRLGTPDSICDLLFALWRAGASQDVRALAARAAGQADVSDPQATLKLAKTIRVAGAPQEALSLIRRASKIAALHGGNLSFIWESFPGAESADLRTAAEILMYGPASGKQIRHPWSWADLHDQDSAP